MLRSSAIAQGSVRDSLLGGAYNMALFPNQINSRTVISLSVRNKNCFFLILNVKVSLDEPDIQFLLKGIIVFNVLNWQFLVSG